MRWTQKTLVGALFVLANRAITLDESSRIGVSCCILVVACACGVRLSSLCGCQACGQRLSLTFRWLALLVVPSSSNPLVSFSHLGIPFIFVSVI